MAALNQMKNIQSISTDYFSWKFLKQMMKNNGDTRIIPEQLNLIPSQPKLHKCIAYLPLSIDIHF